MTFNQEKRIWHMVFLGFLETFCFHNLQLFHDQAPSFYYFLLLTLIYTFREKNMLIFKAHAINNMQILGQMGQIVSRVLCYADSTLPGGYLGLIFFQAAAASWKITRALQSRFVQKILHFSNLFIYLGFFYYKSQHFGVVALHWILFCLTWHEANTFKRLTSLV